jgi:hypothetical protein
MGELAGDPFTPYVRSVTISNDFRNVVVDVDRAEYENAPFTMSHLVVAMTVLMYQMFDGQEGRVNIEYRDVDGGDLITTHAFP